MDKSAIKNFSETIKNSNNIVFFGGAGVSTASNIPDFRSAQGIFSQKLHQTFSPEELVSHTFYKQYPDDFFKFYKDKLVYKDAKPNPCHYALAELESMGKLKAVITQNVDGLHQMAGSKKVFELHGSVHRNYCESCHSFYDLDFILGSEGIPTCEKCGARVKPDVVLYEEPLDSYVMQQAVTSISNADTLIIGGTSLVVYPAAGMISYFRGKNLVLINKSSTFADTRANIVINDDIAKVFEETLENL